MSLKTIPFKVEAVGASKNERDLLTMRRVGEKTKEAICRKLSQLERNTVLEMDFSSIRFIDVSCADEVVVKVMARLEAGEYPDRFIILSHIDTQHRENIETALKVAKKAVIVKENEGWSLLGELVNSYRKALSKVMEFGSITARELQKEMGYNTVNQASTKLIFIYQRCLIAREPYREAVRGGGRQFRYLSLLQGKKEELNK